MAKFSFAETIEKLRSTPKGKEASMYGPIRDIFIHVLGYPSADVDIDTIGEGGRPDVTARAPSGLRDAKGRQLKIDWVVVEAKDEPDCFTNPKSREVIFEKKSKYVGPHTAWFVMVEPCAWVLRPVAGNTLSSDADIHISLDARSEQDFKQRVEALAFERAGVSTQLGKFREGEMSMIGVEKLSLPEATPPTTQLANKIRLNKKRFFQQVREATVHLQAAVSGALARLEPEIDAYQQDADNFWAEFGRRNDDCFDQHSLTIRGTPSGTTQSRHLREIISMSTSDEVVTPPEAAATEAATPEATATEEATPEATATEAATPEATAT